MTDLCSILSWQEDNLMPFIKVHNMKKLDAKIFPPEMYLQNFSKK